LILNRSLLLPALPKSISPQLLWTAVFSSVAIANRIFAAGERWRGSCQRLNISNAIKAFLCAVPMLITAGCAQELGSLQTGSLLPTKADRIPDVIPGVPKGYTCPVVPNTFDPAGSIYRIDASGTFYRVADLGSKPFVVNNRRPDVMIADYVLSDEQAARAGISARLLKTALPDLSVEGNLDEKVSVEIIVKDIRADIIYDTGADEIIQWFQKNIKPRKGSKYFIVREAIQAGAVTYRLERKDLAKFGGSARIEQIAEGKTNVTVRDNNSTFEITQIFSPRINVCVKPDEIKTTDRVQQGVDSAGDNDQHDPPQPPQAQQRT
jgi:hypothetical protein